MLPDDLAQAIANLGAAAVPIHWLCRLLRGHRGQKWFRSGAELLDRAKADAVGLPQRPVHCPRFGYAHLGAVDQRGHIGGIRIAESDEAFTVSGSKNCSFECPTAHPRVTECPHGQDSDASTPPPVREAQKSSVRDVPMIVQVQQIPRYDGYGVCGDKRCKA